MVSVQPVVVNKNDPHGAVHERSSQVITEDAMIGNFDQYIDDVTKQIDAGVINIKGNPWVAPVHSFVAACELNAQRAHSQRALMDATEALNLALRPMVFVWAPEKIFPGLCVKCPACNQAVKSSRWWRHKMLHGIQKQHLYVSVEYTCYGCVLSARPDRHAEEQTAPTAKRRKKQKTFLADSQDALNLLPPHVAATWQFVDTGRVLCEVGVVDIIRALATKTSWAAISDMLNEMKSTHWVANVIQEFLHLCDRFQLRPSRLTPNLPHAYRVTDSWVRNIYVRDAQQRQAEVKAELTAEVGDDVLVLDWTKDAAARCGGAYLFNVMDGNKRILLSSLTKSASPSETKPLIAQLARRGVYPKLVYVDDECCGEWPSILKTFWPNVMIRLDGMHAIRRLTKTVTCTQHPYHMRFCSALAEAVYTQDEATLARLSSARLREGYGKNVPANIRNKYVPRVIKDAPRIAASIESTIEVFERDRHEEAGHLLTAATRRAWTNLKKHVCAGCLCDPYGVSMNVFGASVAIGGDKFRIVQTIRGASALEGFHTHQKNWLGSLAHHGPDAGGALLADGALRWNRRRRCEKHAAVASVFAGGVLQRADASHRSTTGQFLYPQLRPNCAPP